MTSQAPKSPVQKPISAQAEHTASPAASQDGKMRLKPQTTEAVDAEPVIVYGPSNSSDSNKSTVSSAEHSNVLPESKPRHEVPHQPKNQRGNDVAQGNHRNSCQQQQHQPRKGMTEGNLGFNCEQLCQVGSNRIQAKAGLIFHRRRGQVGNGIAKVSYRARIQRLPGRVGNGIANVSYGTSFHQLPGQIGNRMILVKYGTNFPQLPGQIGNRIILVNYGTNFQQLPGLIGNGMNQVNYCFNYQ